jgi:hypothetical protein
MNINQKTCVLIYFLWIAKIALVQAGEVRITIPAGTTTYVSASYIDSGEIVELPEPATAQENQIRVYHLADLKSGTYRISLVEAAEPLGRYRTLMETHVMVSKESKESVFLFEPTKAQILKLPDEVKDILRKNQGNYIELYACYENGVRFPQVLNSANTIWYLRDDCEYDLKVFAHSFREYPLEPQVIYEKKFRTIKREVDPFEPGGI